MSDHPKAQYDSVRSVLLTAVRAIKPDLAAAPLSGDEHLAAELGVDSVDRMEMLIAVEEAFGVEDEVDPRLFMLPPTINELAARIAVTETAPA
ncbi:acyl carrier protein [Phytomonospora sp. NPDC050363]|uniref:acyl carrier protein n=1 Tax=Phytomonospora sp. NPDC050363 TaxID=3155642 RepID=UPI0033D9FE08